MSKKQIESPILWKKTPHFIVIGPMPFRWEDLLFHAFPQKTVVIFVDGGSIHRRIFLKKAPQYLQNSLSIGDGDSSLIEMDIKKTDQNLSDLDFFLETLLRYNKLSKTKLKTLVLAGFLGQKKSALNRFDHLLFNFSALLRFRQRLPFLQKINFSMENKVYFYGAGTHRLKLKGTFSFLSIWDNQVKISGQCEYKTLKKRKIPVLSSEGLSNKGLGMVQISASKAFFLITS